MDDGAHAASPSRAWSVGIDFGTAFSKAAATRTVPGLDGRPTREVRPLHIGAAGGWRSAMLAPSAVFLNRQLVHFGPNAHARLRDEGHERRELLQSFKTMLGANDFEVALNFSPPRPVDPDGTFRLRDLMVLYLAYLLVLIDVAARDTIMASGAQMRLRYSRPGWIPHRSEAARDAMARLFQEAHNTRIALGEALLDPAGLPYKIARDALSEGRVTYHGAIGIDGGVFEASAVAACHFLDPAAPDHIVIVDIGAGTTDVAGLVRTFNGDARVIPAARQTVNVAGDAFDRALMQLLMTKAKALRTRAEQMAFWRQLLPAIREMKEALFRDGAVEARFMGHAFQCTAREVARSQHFKFAMNEIAAPFQRGLDQMIRTAREDGASRVGVVLSGGGSNLPPIVEMAGKKAQRGAGPVAVEIIPATPKWANDMNSTAEFNRLFAQLCVAFGTAIAAQGQLQDALI